MSTQVSGLGGFFLFMKSEQWKSVVGYEGKYEVSDLGRFRALTGKRLEVLPTPKSVECHLDVNGYHKVHLWRHSKARTFSAHRLVAIAFLGKPDGFQVHHKDGCRTNNAVSNLEWITARKNMALRKPHALTKLSFSKPRVMEPIYVPTLSQMRAETWRPCVSAPDYYEVSSVGRIRRVGSDTMKSLNRQPHRYLYAIGSCPGGKRFSLSCHCEVAFAFIGPRPRGFHINHKDGRKTNNCVSNLEYVTCKANQQHAAALGLKARGTRQGCSKLSESDVRKIRALSKTINTVQLARRFRVTRTTINGIIKLRSWKWLK